MLNTQLLHKFTIKTLRENSWKSGRCKDISSWIAILEKEGYKSFPYAIEILKELGGLFIKPKKIKIGEYYPGSVDFNPVNAGSGEVDRLEYFEPLAGETLFPLGEAYAQWYLYVGVSKKIYIGSIREFIIVGNNIEDFLNHIFLGEGTSIPLHK